MQVNPSFDGRPNDAALARYLSGESALDERLDIERWVARDPSRRTMLSYMAATWEQPKLAVETWDTEVLLANLIARRDQMSFQSPASPSATALSASATLHSTTSATFSPSSAAPHLSATRHLSARRPFSRFSWSTAMPVFATLAIVAIVAVGVGTYVSQRKIAASSSSAASSVASRATDQWKFATAPGQRAVVTLVDGTTVTLGVSSQLYPSPGFGVGNREVVLEGEAYFDVVNDASAPFIVRAGETVTRVLGTTFNVRKYPTDSKVMVAVSAGKVAVGHQDAATLLSAGDVGSIDQDGTSTITHDPSLVNSQSQWRQGWLVLDNLTLRDAVVELSRWYDLDVRIANNALAERHITVSFQHELPQAVIRSIAQALGARAEWSGRQVTFFER